MILPALFDAVRRYRIPRKYLFAAIDGVEMDLGPRRYETFEELRPYCERVASAVGLACIHVWGFSGPEAFEPARQLGIAMQLTNILRDLKEDAAAGRIYLPLAELRECGYSEEDLAAGVADERFERLMAGQIERAEQFYAGGSRLMGMIDRSGRRMLRLMTGTYHTILRKIASRPADVFGERIRLSRWEKAKLVVSGQWPVASKGSGFRGQGRRKKEEGSRFKVQGSKTADCYSLSPLPSVAIVGGGLAGLAAAVAAVERGFRVEVFERAKNLGGRAGSFVDSQIGERVDYCHHVAMGCCTSFLEFCRRTGVEDCFERSGDLHFIGPDGRQSDFSPWPRLPAPLHLLPALFGLKYLSAGEKFSIARALGRLAKEKAAAETTAGEWLRRHGQTERTLERFWSVVLVSALGETLDRVSLAAARKVFCAGFMAGCGASDLVLPRRPLGEIFSDRMEKWLVEHGATVHLDAPVKKIEGDGRRATAVALSDGRREFDCFVSAVPWREAREIFDEKLLAAQPGLADVGKIAPAEITTVHFWFDREISKLPHAALVGRLGQWVFFDSARDGKQHCQVIISASHRLAERNREEWTSEIAGELRAIWPAAREATVLHSRVVRLPSAIFSVLPGTDFLRPRQQTPIENLVLAGDWTATDWPATMESAVRSGFLAVEALC